MNKPLQAKQIALLTREACLEKKGREIVVLNVRRQSPIADFLVIVSGTSTRHVDALADHVIHRLREEQIHLKHAEGRSEARWILLDYGDVIVHLFHYETRRFYNLERLWGDAAHVEPISRKKKSVKK